MKIIKEGNPKKARSTSPISFTCSDCGLEAELECGEDISICPCCGSSNLVFTTPLVATDTKKKSVSEMFPHAFCHFGATDGNDTVAVGDEETSVMIDNTIGQYKAHGGGYAFSATGDTFVAVFQTDEDYKNNFIVVVSKDHYEYEVVNGEL